jgi:hypothetical protein
MPCLFGHSRDLLFSNKRLYFKHEAFDICRWKEHRAMADTSIVFEENIAPAVAAQQARGLADYLRTATLELALVASGCGSAKVVPWVRSANRLSIIASQQTSTTGWWLAYFRPR